MRVKNTDKSNQFRATTSTPTTSASASGTIVKTALSF